MQPPAEPKVYHIVHVDRLPSIIADGNLWSDAEVQRRTSPGTTIGIPGIKHRRLNKSLKSHPGLHVGDCVPFYFCPRSVMLYVISKQNNPSLSYTDGQNPIVHLEADLREAAAWADFQGRRWAFTLSNAGSFYFEDRCNLVQLEEIDWEAVQATDWRSCKEEKQAEFLVERSFPWTLIRRVGVRDINVLNRVRDAIRMASHRPAAERMPPWYY